MATIAVAEKRKLGDLLGLGHGKFGKVRPRRPYREEDEGGEGAPGINLLTHPLFVNQPIGAADDLTFNASKNVNSTEAALERKDELCAELKKQPVLQAKQEYQYRSTPKPSPL